MTFIHLGGGFAAEVYYLTLSTTASVVHFSLVEVATVITDGLVVGNYFIARMVRINLFLTDPSSLCRLVVQSSHRDIPNLHSSLSNRCALSHGSQRIFNDSVGQ
jgi:hypothetical protein